MTKSCRAYLSFIGEIRTSKFRSAPRRWQSTVTSLESSTRLGRSESQRSAIKSEQLQPLRLQVPRRRQVLHHHRRPNPKITGAVSLLRRNIPTLLLTGTRYQERA